ncbi:flavin-containing monooxygenase FMO GS-OX5-like isoform X6 [Diospyros lotus]|uniref:flavin-containing monooxygenase FMO GS-OX5-like isoform X6 n=1 Tax=Diospyros lotus TaxID=55363 RepID=UPI002257B848|nr:flavin-containing monooxygenase FMO GS-OX5-like isoform X6 [Diospyros lotus]
MGRSVKVAVIGAGISGLLAARELKREGHQVVVFERYNRIGGIWVYDPRVESDLLSLDPNREVILGSAYLSLRTNLPRPIMSFTDYPFRMRKETDSYFPGHVEVLEFIQSFAKDHGLVELIRFEKDVVRVERVDESRNDQWVVEWRTRVNESEWEKESEVFEAVVICNGHHTTPRVADFPGFEKFPGRQVHSHNYRVPDPYKNEVVVMIGAGASTYDLCREVSKVAKEVHLASRAPDAQVSRLNDYPNVWQHLKIVDVSEDGTVTFEEGSSIRADTIVHCTGYSYDFPFLKTNGIVTVDENRVGPLYKHVFPPKLAPYISFVGLPQRAMLFYTFELEARWIAGALSGKFRLPSEEDMLGDTEAYYRKMEEHEVGKQHTHSIFPLQHDHHDWLAAEVGVVAPSDRLKKIHGHILTLVKMQRDNVRDDIDREMKLEDEADRTQSWYLGEP